MRTKIFSYRVTCFIALFLAILFVISCSKEDTFKEGVTNNSRLKATGCTCDAGCSVSSTIAAPYSKDGAGEYCLVASCLGSYINSWCLVSLKINGVDYTNRWLPSSQVATNTDGKYYIYYKGSYGWSHFEIGGSCSGSETSDTAKIDLTSVQQTIDGFGAATVWNGALSDAEADAIWGNSAGQMGLSICRVHFDPNGNDADDMSNATKAKARGAVILSSVWSPPASMKSNSSTIGGYLNPSSYAAYASWLASEKSKFGNIDIVSIQNEPNISVNYESCDWTAAQLLTFCQDNAQSIGGDVMMPEAYNFDVNYSDPTLNNAIAASHITHIGGHIYGSSPFKYTNAISKGKKIWMTEHYFDPDDIGTCMVMGKEILDCMCNNMNAYVWWYVKSPSCNLINSGGSFTRKGYIMAQFAKFIRPGYQRVDATYNPTGSVYVCAYSGSKITVVAVNQGNSSANVTFNYKNGTLASVTKYTTSGSKNLSNDGSITITGNTFKTTLDAQSVTTFVQN